MQSSSGGQGADLEEKEGRGVCVCVGGGVAVWCHAVCSDLTSCKTIAEPFYFGFQTSFIFPAVVSNVLHRGGSVVCQHNTVPVSERA